MRAAVTGMTATGVALTLAACGPKTLALPGDPIDRAATCGVVAAATARQAAGIKAALPIEAQGRILHYALLAGCEGAVFDADKAQAVVTRMPQLQEKVTAGKWQGLAQPCAAAYPETANKPVELPRDPLSAELSCYMLDDFLKTALQSQGAHYEQALIRYSALSTKLDARVGAKLGGLKGDALQQRRQEALATAAKLGTPSRVMDACLVEFD